MEKALTFGYKALLLTMDIKRVFNTVLPGRLACRLYKQGWPNYLVYWVYSFAT